MSALGRLLDAPARREARLATQKTWVDCAGCGRTFRGYGLLCGWCHNHSRPNADTPRRPHGDC